MSSSTDWQQPVSHQEALRAYDGAERVALLPYANLVAVSPGAPEEAKEPAYVFIEWAPGVIERPYPGSAIWRAALEAYLARQHGEMGGGDDQSYHLLRPIVEDDLRRFPNLDAWLHWLHHGRIVPAESLDSHRAYSWRSVVWPW